MLYKYTDLELQKRECHRLSIRHSKWHSQPVGQGQLILVPLLVGVRVCSRSGELTH